MLFLVHVQICILRPCAVLPQGEQPCQGGHLLSQKWTFSRRNSSGKGLFNAVRSTFTCHQWFSFFLILPWGSLFSTLSWRSTWEIQQEYDHAGNLVFLPLLFNTCLLSLASFISAELFTKDPLILLVPMVGTGTNYWVHGVPWAICPLFCHL